MSETLIGESIGLLPVDDRYYTVYFAAFPIARFDSYKRVIVRCPNETSSPGVGQEKGIHPLPLHPFPSRHHRKKCQECPRSKVSDMSPAEHSAAPTALLISDGAVLTAMFAASSSTTHKDH